MSDSFLVFYDFDILSMIKRKNPFRTGGSAIDFPKLITADGLTGNEDGTARAKPLN